MRAVTRSAGQRTRNKRSSCRNCVNLWNSKCCFSTWNIANSTAAFFSLAASASSPPCGAEKFHSWNNACKTERETHFDMLGIGEKLTSASTAIIFVIICVRLLKRRRKRKWIGRNLFVLLLSVSDVSNAQQLTFGHIRFIVSVCVVAACRSLFFFVLITRVQRTTCSNTVASFLSLFLFFRFFLFLSVVRIGISHT